MNPGFCPFCNYRGPSHVIARYAMPTGNVIVFQPIGPVTDGHVLVVPERHVADIAESPETAADVMAAVARYIRDYKIGSCNVITSRGAPATQTVFHLHVHVVPRRPHDGLALPWTL